MKEVKAYIQRCATNRVVKALQQAGAPGITIVEIHPVGYGYEPNYFDLAFESEDIVKRYRNISVVKIEVVCADEDAARFIATIQETASTGCSGDGRIFVTDVGEAIRIRDGARGKDAL